MTVVARKCLLFHSSVNKSYFILFFIVNMNFYLSAVQVQNLYVQKFSV